jgi:hypothetical protein
VGGYAAHAFKKCVNSTRRIHFPGG